MSFADVAQSRHVAARAATLTFSGTDEDGQPADPGVVTVAVTNSAGETVTAGAVSVVATNNRTSVISAADSPTVDRLQAVWSSGGVELETTYHDIVGGVYCSVADIRDGSSLNNETTHTSASLIIDRSEAEYQIESACNRAFVPRFWSETLSGTGHSSVMLEKPDLRDVVWANYWTGSAWAPITGVVADIPPSGVGVAILRSDFWPAGHNNVQIGYRYGWNRPPADLKRAAAKAVQHHRHTDSSGIPDRAISIQGSELGNVVLATPGLGRWVTAVPGIDEVLNRYKFTRIRSA